MIDAHCHLSYEDFDEDRDTVIQKAQKQMKAVIDSGPSPADAKKSLEMHRKYPNFVYSTLGLHPTEAIKLNEKQIEAYIEFIKTNKEKIHGIGEVGLDFKIQEERFRKRQKELFIKFIELSENMKLPLVIHSREAYKEAIEILENYQCKKVLMHFFTAKELLEKIIENDWYISVNTTLLTSKKIKKIVRDLSINRILTETDSPWLGLENKRNDPTSVKIVGERIVEIKKIKIEEVDRITTQNAIKFFNLTL